MTGIVLVVRESATILNEHDLCTSQKFNSEIMCHFGPFSDNYITPMICRPKRLKAAFICLLYKFVTAYWLTAEDHYPYLSLARSECSLLLYLLYNMFSVGFLHSELAKQFTYLIEDAVCRDAWVYLRKVPLGEMNRIGAAAAAAKKPYLGDLPLIGNLFLTKKISCEVTNSMVNHFIFFRYLCNTRVISPPASVMVAFTKVFSDFTSMYSCELLDANTHCMLPFDHIHTNRFVIIRASEATQLVYFCDFLLVNFGGKDCVPSENLLMFRNLLFNIMSADCNLCWRNKV